MLMSRRKRSAGRTLNRCILESLEGRQLFSLVGVGHLLQPPTVLVDSGAINYTAGVGVGTLDVYTALSRDDVGTSGFAHGNLHITATVNTANGALAPGGAFTITDENNDSLILLTGLTDPTANQGGFGFDNDVMDFQFTVTGGTLASQYAGKDIGAVIGVEPAGVFTGDFTQSFFDLTAKGVEVGTIPKVTSLPPRIVTVPGPAIVIGSGNKLTDSATLSNVTGNPVGNITFRLYTQGTVPLPDGSNAIFTNTVATNGNGTYSTSAGYLPLTVGTYQWVATYTDGTVVVPSVLGDEPETVKKAGPNIVTCASLTCGNIVNHAIPQDSAVLSGSFNGTGSLLFTLKGPDGTTTVYTETVTVSGDGTYVTHSNYVATQAGTYTWKVSYSGDSLNNGAIDQGGPAEQVTILKGGSIRGTKYVDCKGDDCSTNIGSGDDTVYTGTPITLQLYQGNTLVATTQTDANGNYSFDNLAAGTYTIKEVVPSGWVLTAQSSGSVTVTNTSVSTGNNFADFKLICIMGKKFLDRTGNGLSSDDTALGGVKIQLFKNGGSTPVATTTTAADGSYSFSNLGPGTYTVKEVTPSGYLQTGPVSGTYTINATSGSTYDHRDFDNFKLDDCELTCISYVINGCTTVSDISGKLHQGDTVKVTFTISEPETVSFVSYTAPDPYFDANDASEQEIFDFATGVYTKAGTYSLTITVPNCYYQVDLICGLPIDQLGPAGSNIFYTPQGRLHDSDNGGTTPCDCDNPTGTGSIAGSVYDDCNNNGIRDLGETGISGVKVKLSGTQVNGTVITLYATTDSNGNYKFSNLKAGVYQLNETQPSGYYDGKDRVGSLGGTLGNDVLSTINLGSGQAGVNYTFGELDGASIAGKVYNDKDRDGCIDYNDTGLCSVKLVLSGVNDLGQSVSYTTYTDASGNFSFDNIRQGTYTLTEYTPSGYATTKNVAGTEGGTVSGDKISNITLEWCDNACGYNFGEYRCY